jgi:hypothetical protein
MQMLFKTGFSVTTWSPKETFFNLSDATGDHPIHGKKSKLGTLPEKLQSEILETEKEALAELKLDNEETARAKKELKKVWHSGIIQYDPNKEPYCLLTKGYGGIGATQAKDAIHLACFNSRQKTKNGHTEIPDSRLHAYYGCLIDGGFVLDKTPALDITEAYAFRSPMYLPTVKEHDPEKTGGFDYVTITTYMNWWTERGARLGTRKGNIIEWTDKTEQILLPENRFKHQP